MSEAIEKANNGLSKVDAEEALRLMQMDINGLSVQDRAKYLFYMAKTRGLDPSTKPFDLIPGRNNKLIIYANASCADQLREIHGISIETLYAGPLMIGGTTRDDVFLVRQRATLVREDGKIQSYEDCGAASILNLSGEDLSNAIMKAYTKASRRVTLGIKGLGMPDVSEISDIVDAQVVEKPQLTEPRTISVTPSPPPEMPESKASTPPTVKRKYGPVVSPVKG